MLTQVYLRTLWVLLTLINIVFVGCGDHSQSRKKSVQDVHSEQVSQSQAEEQRVCMVACEEILSCHEFSICSAEDLQSALSLCFLACERGEGAEIISDAELICVSNPLTGLINFLCWIEKWV